MDVLTVGEIGARSQNPGASSWDRYSVAGVIDNFTFLLSVAWEVEGFAILN